MCNEASAWPWLLRRTLFLTLLSSSKIVGFSSSLLETALLCTVSKETLQAQTLASTISSSALSPAWVSKAGSRDLPAEDRS